jgi:hypothetical protein
MAGKFPSALHAARNRPIAATLHARRRNPLAACVASILALAAPAPAMAATWTVGGVSRCDGDAISGDIPTKTGTLRFALANAVSGDTIELAGLTGANGCLGSKISLTTGSLSANQASLTLHGPGFSSLTIDASTLPHSPSSIERVLTHSGNGTLTIAGLHLKGGYVNYYVQPAYGGCLYSKGNVYLKNAYVSSCKAYGRYNTAQGGGVFASGYVRMTGSYVLSSTALGQSGTVKGGGVFSNSNVYLSSSEVAGSTAKSGNPITAGGSATGGGIYAKGKLGAVGSYITGNIAYSTGASAFGGGAFVGGDTTLQLSYVSGNKAQPGSGQTSAGGGLWAAGNFVSGYTTISKNHAEGSGYGGGLHLGGAVMTIQTTTISNNVSATGYGGVDAFGGILNPNTSLLVANSTISGNSATGKCGGIYSDAARTKFYNSTIAFNTGASSAGVLLGNTNHGIALTIGSTLISNNVVGGIESDIGAKGGFAITVNGGNPAINGYNLVRTVSSALITLPNDTKSGCPHLGKLRDNGGLTQTHALLSHSLAIDAGFNVTGSAYDQRGPKSVNGVRDFVRPSGPAGQPPITDIGAHEVQQDDIVFDVDFEDCPGLP